MGEGGGRVHVSAISARYICMFLYANSAVWREYRVFVDVFVRE